MWSNFCRILGLCFLLYVVKRCKGVVKVLHNNNLIMTHVDNSFYFIRTTKSYARFKIIVAYYARYSNTK